MYVPVYVIFDDVVVAEQHNGILFDEGRINEKHKRQFIKPPPPYFIISYDDSISKTTTARVNRSRKPSFIVTFNYFYYYYVIILYIGTVFDSRLCGSYIKYSTLSGTRKTPFCIYIIFK